VAIDDRNKEMKTLREYCKQYEGSDSVSEREKLEEEIESIARNYLNALYRASLKYKTKSIFDMSEYRDDRGGLTFEDCSSSYLEVRYTDRWSYGGQCDERFTIKFDDIESFNEDNLKKESIELAKSSLKNEIKNIESKLKKAKEDLKKLEMEK
jgi:hypothetical protein